jgi:hypothetical protein
MNIPIIMGVMMTAPTPFNVVLWQTINQTCNAGLNYGNRNASSTQSMQTTLRNYVMAVTSAVSIAMLGRYLSKPLMVK